jgi:enamine deaminase RidA (YjgF/YER057c/UK114 family)
MMMTKMKHAGILRIATAALLLASTALFTVGCSPSGGASDAQIEKIARRIAEEEIDKAREEWLASFEPDTYGFGGALEKEWAHAQGCKVGNFIFVSGQQPYDTNLDEEGMPITDLETGRSFDQQLTTCLENVQQVLEHYGATMNDVVMLQGFVDLKAGDNKADFGNAAPVITNFFPNAQQSMTFISVDDLYGEEQLIEVNAIAVMSKMGK